MDIKSLGRRRRPAGREPKQYRPGPFFLTYFALLLLGALVALGAYLSIGAVVRPTLASERLEAAKTSLTVAAAVGAIAVLYVGYRKQRTDEANSVREQDRLFTERYTQAVAQLGGDRPAVRLGGVYALARIADDSPRDRDTCLSLLCAYLRMPSEGPDDAAGSEENVREAALASVLERLQPTHRGFWSGSRLNLVGARIDLLHLDKVHIGEVLLVGAQVRETLIGESTIDHADFTGTAFGGNFICFGTTINWASFRHCAFGTPASNDEVKFDDTEFGLAAWFDDATFEIPLTFNGVKLPEHGSFDGAQFLAGRTFSHLEETANSEFVLPE